MATMNQFNFYLFRTARGKELSDKLFFPNLISHIIKESIFYLNNFLPLRKFPISCRREYNNKISLLRFLRSKLLIFSVYTISPFSEVSWKSFSLKITLIYSTPVFIIVGSISSQIWYIFPYPKLCNILNNFHGKEFINFYF